jgi:hypothetical protein
MFTVRLKEKGVCTWQGLVPEYPTNTDVMIAILEQSQSGPRSPEGSRLQWLVSYMISRPYDFTIEVERKSYVSSDTHFVW